MGEDVTRLDHPRAVAALSTAAAMLAMHDAEIDEARVLKLRVAIHAIEDVLEIPRGTLSRRDLALQ